MINNAALDTSIFRNAWLSKASLSALMSFDRRSRDNPDPYQSPDGCDPSFRNQAGSVVSSGGPRWRAEGRPWWRGHAARDAPTKRLQPGPRGQKVALLTLYFTFTSASFSGCSELSPRPGLNLKPRKGDTDVGGNNEGRTTRRGGGASSSNPNRKLRFKTPCS